MNDVFEKINQLNLVVGPEEVFDFIGADIAKDDGLRITYTCPYHTDDSPSLLVTPRDGKFNCFACACGGQGAYSCAKYYLAFTNNGKPTMMDVVNFLCQINPKVEQFKYLFEVRRVRAYESGVNKRKEFSRRLITDQNTTALAVQRRHLNAEQMAAYIDAVMTGLPEEFIIQAVGVKQSKHKDEGSAEFLALLGEDV